MSTIEKFKNSWFVKELPQLLLLLVFILAARSSFADHYYVPSGSMQYTLMEGDRVVVDKRAYGLRLPFTLFKLTAGDPVGRGEIVIFDSPVDGKRLIKRIVAVGGDSVELRDGLLKINGESLLRSGSAPVEVFGERDAFLNLSSGILNNGGGPNISGLEVPEGMLLAIGDHRGSSTDSRVFGLVPQEIVYGKALAVYHRSGEGFQWREL